MVRCTPLNHTAAMLKLSGQSDPDPQRYLRQTQTDRQTEIPCFYSEIPATGHQTTCSQSCELSKSSRSIHLYSTFILQFPTQELEQ